MLVPLLSLLLLTPLSEAKEKWPCKRDARSVGVAWDAGDLQAAEIASVQLLACREDRLPADAMALAEALWWRGRVLAAQGAYADGVTALERAVAIESKVPMDEVTTYTVETLVVAMVDARQPDRALPLQERSVAWARAEAPHRLSTSLGLLATVHLRLGSVHLAEQFAREAVDSAQTDTQRGAALAHLGSVLLSAGHGLAAEEALYEAEAVLVAVLPPDHEGIWAVRDNLATAMYFAGHYTDALLAYEELIEHGRARGTADLVVTLLGYADLLDELGDVSRARTVCEEAIALAAELLPADHPDRISAEQLLGVMLLRSRHDAEAVTQFERVLAMQRAHSTNVMSVPHVLLQLSNAHNVVGEVERGWEEAVEARQIMLDHVAHDAPLMVGFDLAVALAAMRTDRLAEAQRVLDHAIAIADPADPGSELPIALHLSARLALAAGDVEQARGLAQRAVERQLLSLERISAITNDRAGRQGLIDAVSLLGLFLDLAAADPDGEEAWAAVLRFKGLPRRSLIEHHLAALAQSDPASESLLASLESVNGRLARAMLLEDDRASVAELTSERAQLVDRLTRLAGSSLDSAPTPGEVCRALPEGSALVEYVRVAEPSVRFDDPPVPAYRAFVVRAAECERVQQVRLGTASTIDVAAERFRRLTSMPTTLSSRLEAASLRFGAMVWDPLAPALEGIETVYVVPDGALSVVPFAALREDGRFLVETRELRYLESPNDLVTAPTSRSALPDVALVGDVDYAGVPETPCLASPVAALPGTKDELRELGELAVKAGGGVSTVDGAGATAAAVRDTLAGRGIVHFATHGYFAEPACFAYDTPPMVRSGLVLSDGVWTAEQIATLDLRSTWLSVLSACDTGRGEVTSNDGVMGLRRAFSVAGSDNVVMSLWPVHDEATRELMRRLYTHLLSDHAAPAEALRQAQIEVLQQNRASQGEAFPHAWAGFIASGASVYQAP